MVRLQNPLLRGWWLSLWTSTSLVVRGADVTRATALTLTRVAVGGCQHLPADNPVDKPADDAARGEARALTERLVELAGMVEGTWSRASRPTPARWPPATRRGLLRASETFESMGALLYAADAAAEASRAVTATGLKSTALALAAWARSPAGQCEGARTPALVDLDQPLPLTRRERQVVTVAARGLSNPEIAEHLVVSVSTAEGDPIQVFAKLGMTQRHELRSVIGSDPTSGPGEVKTGSALPVAGAGAGATLR